MPFITRKSKQREPLLASFTVENDLTNSNRSLGITLSHTEENRPLLVTAVDQTGPLAPKLFVGDKVWELNGKNVAKLGKKQRHKHLLDMKNADIIHFKVERGPNAPTVIAPAPSKDTLSTDRLNFEDHGSGSSGHEETPAPELPSRSPRAFDPLPRTTYPIPEERTSLHSREPSRPRSIAQEPAIVQAMNNIPMRRSNSDVRERDVGSSRRQSTQKGTSSSSSDEHRAPRGRSTSRLREEHAARPRARSAETSIISSELTDMKKTLERQTEMFNRMSERLDHYERTAERMTTEVATLNRRRFDSNRLWVTPTKQRLALPEPAPLGRKYDSLPEYPDGYDHHRQVTDIRQASQVNAMDSPGRHGPTEYSARPRYQKHSSNQDRQRKVRRSGASIAGASNAGIVAMPSKIGQVKRVIMYKQADSLGLGMCGGNSRGLFVTHIAPTVKTSRQSPQLQIGDKILAADGSGFYRLTIEEASRKLAGVKPGNSIEMYVQYSPDEYDYVSKHSIADDFYVRTNYEFKDQSPAGIIIPRSTVLHVLNTMYEPESWYALLEDNKTPVVVPSRFTLTENAYDQVILSKTDTDVKRPVILHGDLAQCARAAMLKASPDGFCDGHKSHGVTDRHRLFVSVVDGPLRDLESAVNITVTCTDKVFNKRVKEIYAENPAANKKHYRPSSDTIAKVGEVLDLDRYNLKKVKWTTLLTELVDAQQHAPVWVKVPASVIAM